MSKPAGTLVIAPGALGDTVLRALALRQLFTHGVVTPPVTIVGTRAYLPVYRAFLPDPLLQPYEDRLWSTLFLPSSQPPETLCEILRSTRLAIVWLPKDTAAAAKLRTCGVQDVRWADPSVAGQKEHQLLTLLRAAGFHPNDEQAPPRPQGLLETVWRLRRILVHPGAGSDRKRLPSSRYSQVSALLEDSGWKVTWLLGPVELEDRNLVAQADRYETLRCQQTDQLMEHLRSYPLVFGNDSGVEHLAAALGSVVLNVFVSTKPDRWHPVGPLTVALDLTAGSPQVRAFQHLFEVEVEAALAGHFGELVTKIAVVVSGEGAARL